jgi:hypothetical protein
MWQHSKGRLPMKNKTRIEVVDNNKHTSLLHCGLFTTVQLFIVQALAFCIKFSSG